MVDCCDIDPMEYFVERQAAFEAHMRRIGL